MLIYGKTLRKTGQSLEVTFTTAFKEPPVVIVTPFYRNKSAVQHQEIISEITGEGCTITSPNMAPDYAVGILAMPAATEDMRNGLRIVSGSQPKKEKEIIVEYPAAIFEGTQAPVVMISAYWKDGTQAVTDVDTVDLSDKKKCSIISSNLMSTGDYKMQYICSDRGFREGGSSVWNSGIANKTSGGPLRVYFAKAFTVPPTVVLTPWWNAANRSVGGVETVIDVTNDYFVLSSANGDPGYFVNWTAYGEF